MEQPTEPIGTHPYHHGHGVKVYDRDCPLCCEGHEPEPGMYVPWSLYDLALRKAKKVEADDVHPDDIPINQVPREIIPDRRDAIIRTLVAEVDAAKAYSAHVPCMFENDNRHDRMEAARTTYTKARAATDALELSEYRKEEP